MEIFVKDCCGKHPISHVFGRERILFGLECPVCGRKIMNGLAPGSSGEPCTLQRSHIEQWNKGVRKIERQSNI